MKKKKTWQERKDKPAKWMVKWRTGKIRISLRTTRLWLREVSGEINKTGRKGREGKSWKGTGKEKCHK